MKYSFIIPVYNRPKEIEELLASFLFLKTDKKFEIVIVEDGSEEDAEAIVQTFKEKLTIHYFQIENQGAGKARNYGMQQAFGDYFIILDSDVLLPNFYLEQVNKALEKDYTDAFGGPDEAHQSFTPLQKAINYSMTSLLTTGGIRGKKNGVGKFQPRSFNMGISRKAFEMTQGFSDMQYGEDIDLSFRIWEQGLETQLIATAFVYHKRRNTLDSFLKQTHKFGTARPVLNKKFPDTAKLTYWFPSIFIIGFAIASLGFMFGYWQLIVAFNLYFTLLFVHSLAESKNIKVAGLSVLTSLVQFIGYGSGFLKSYVSPKFKDGSQK